ncbi:MAG: FliM/FliN family flagellar motor switch protein [Deltaproteobacteria bacterium]|nr:FliM/FliN family flagellar motor switch protein [Deltaproteobacteria bacterium]
MPEAALAQAERTEFATPVREWGLLRDIPFHLTLEIGRTRMKVRDILALESGSLVVTTKLSGEPMDISLNGDVFARAEIVIIKDKLWARVTKIVGGER